MNLCVCGHSQERHVYGSQWCTWQERAIEGNGFKSCHCPAFTEPVDLSPRKEDFTPDEPGEGQ